MLLAQGLDKRRHLVVVVSRHHRKEAEKNAELRSQRPQVSSTEASVIPHSLSENTCQ